jgi:hypothetical protein
MVIVGRSVLRCLVGALAASLLVVCPVGRAQAELVGSVSGVITSGGRPVQYAWVSIIPVTPTGMWAGRGVLTSTDERGRYQVDDVYTDFVKVQVRGPVGLATTYWPDAYTFGEAPALRVTAAGARADVDLPKGGSVTGQVVDARTGQPVAGARVTAQAASGTVWEQVGSTGLGIAAQPGSFILVDLPPVPVALWVQAAPGSRHLHQWFDDAAYIGQARWIDGGASTSGLTVRLREGAELSGTVRDDSGSPVPGATVSVVGCPGLCPHVAVTDAEGRYRFDALVPGRAMRVHADGEASGHLGQWYREPGSSEEARLDLAAGQVRAGVDLVLARGAFLSVRVLDDRTGLPLEGMSAELQSLGGPNLGYPSHPREQLEGSSGTAAAPMPPQPSAEGLLGALPAAPPPTVLGGDAGVGAIGTEPADGPPDTLVIGPVPAGEYRLELYPGVRNEAFLPVTWGTATGISPDGRIVLDPGQRAEATVRLMPSGTTPSPAGPGPGQLPGGGSVDDGAGTADGHWPGLPAGFFGPQPGWAS